MESTVLKKSRQPGLGLRMWSKACLSRIRMQVQLTFRIPLRLCRNPTCRKPVVSRLGLLLRLNRQPGYTVRLRVVPIIDQAINLCTEHELMLTISPNTHLIPVWACGGFICRSWLYQNERGIAEIRLYYTDPKCVEMVG